MNCYIQIWKLCHDWSELNLFFYMISERPNNVLGIFDCSFYIRRITLNDYHHQKRMDMGAYNLVETNYLETLDKAFLIPARQEQFIQETMFNNAPVRGIAIALNTITASTRRYTEKQIWCQQFDIRQFRIHRGGQRNVDFDAADKCHLYVMTMKAMNLQDDIPPISIDNCKDHTVLVFGLTLLQDATDNCHYPKLVGEPLRLELNLTFPLEHLSELIVLGWTKVLGSSSKLLCRWKEYLKRLLFLSRKDLIVFSYLSVGILVHFLMTIFHFLSMALFPFQIRNPALCRMSIG